jgi:hypothetical protein
MKFHVILFKIMATILTKSLYKLTFLTNIISINLYNSVFVIGGQFYPSLLFAEQAQGLKKPFCKMWNFSTKMKSKLSSFS